MKLTPEQIEAVIDRVADFAHYFARDGEDFVSGRNREKLKDWLEDVDA